MTPFSEADLTTSPYQLFDTWYGQAAEDQNIEYVNACCLSTLDTSGYPDGRMVLLKGHSEHGDEKGFTFYTNLRSVKGQSLQQTPKASLTFYWDPLGRQLRIKGEVLQVSNTTADEYFASRPRGSRIGAWASQQSQVLANRETLEDSVKKLEQEYDGKEVPRPPHWHGFRIEPKAMEFWQFGKYRLHDRFRYELEANGEWTVNRLWP